ncbi:hypothetical protein ABIC49_000844 [Burkholderia ambifaria]|nr:hypothetical protein [Burkholderia contaminans]
MIHKVLILFALCIAGLAAIAAGFQHIPGRFPVHSPLR